MLEINSGARSGWLEMKIARGVACFEKGSQRSLSRLKTMKHAFAWVPVEERAAEKVYGRMAAARMSAADVGSDV
jgi:hypothetical protein